MAIRPVDLPVLRDEVTTWLDGRDAHTLWRKSIEIGVWSNVIRKGECPYEGSRLLRGYEIKRLREADLIHVSDGMCDLVTAAAQSVPGFTLAREDLPTLGGLLYFANPVASAPIDDESVDIRAMCWSISPDGSGVDISMYGDREQMTPIIKARSQWRDPSKEPRLIYLPGAGFYWRLGHEHASCGAPEDEYMRTTFSALRAAWLLMQQPLAELATPPLVRADRRHLERYKTDPSKIRVLELRRPRHTGPSGESDREYHHQWIVRGHWRQQWFPKREVHRPVWIAPHIKGPEGAPMLGGEKVHTWKR